MKLFYWAGMILIGIWYIFTDYPDVTKDMYDKSKE
jgi:hypothetical protein